MWPDTLSGVGPSWRTCERAPPATAESCGSATAPTSSSAPPRPKPGPPRSAWSPGSMTRAGDAIRRRSLDTSSAGTQRQNELRDIADDDGYAEPNLWTGIGRARSGAGAAIVGDPDQVLAKIRAYQTSAWTLHPVRLPARRRRRLVRQARAALPRPCTTAPALHAARRFSRR